MPVDWMICGNQGINRPRMIMYPGSVRRVVILLSQRQLSIKDFEGRHIAEGLDVA
jgi:hypothetical protein